MSRDKISVIALFDDESTEILKFYQNSIITDTDNRIDIPHLTLAVYDKPIEIDELLKWVVYFCHTHQKISIHVGAIGIFNESKIFALPGFSKDLYQYYIDFQKKYDGICKEYFSINCSEWLPHIGLLYTTVENAKDKFPILIDVFEECTLTIKSLRKTKRTSTGYVTVEEIVLSDHNVLKT